MIVSTSPMKVEQTNKHLFNYQDKSFLSTRGNWLLSLQILPNQDCFMWTKFPIFVFWSVFTWPMLPCPVTISSQLQEPSTTAFTNSPHIMVWHLQKTLYDIPKHYSNRKKYTGVHVHAHFPQGNLFLPCNIIHHEGTSCTSVITSCYSSEKFIIAHLNNISCNGYW